MIVVGVDEALPKEEWYLRRLVKTDVGRGPGVIFRPRNGAVHCDARRQDLRPRAFGPSACFRAGAPTQIYESRTWQGFPLMANLLLWCCALNLATGKEERRHEANPDRRGDRWCLRLSHGSRASGRRVTSHRGCANRNGGREIEGRRHLRLNPLYVRQRVAAGC